MLPPVHPKKTDPENLIREIEDDPLTQLVWSFPNAVHQALHYVSAALQRSPSMARRTQGSLQTAMTASTQVSLKTREQDSCEGNNSFDCP